MLSRNVVTTTLRRVISQRSTHLNIYICSVFRNMTPCSLVTDTAVSEASAATILKLSTRHLIPACRIPKAFFCSRLISRHVLEVAGFRRIVGGTALFWVVTQRRYTWTTIIPKRRRGITSAETSVKNYQSRNVSKELPLSRNVGKELPFHETSVMNYQSRNVGKELPFRETSVRNYHFTKRR